MIKNSGIEITLDLHRLLLENELKRTNDKQYRSSYKPPFFQVRIAIVQGEKIVVDRLLRPKVIGTMVMPVSFSDKNKPKNKDQFCKHCPHHKPKGKLPCSNMSNVSGQDIEF